MNEEKEQVAFTNKRWEYITREHAYEPGTVTSVLEPELIAQGWCRVWADLDLDGVFVVYRRDKRVNERDSK